MALATRKIVKIDEDRCDGCGVCIPSCVEGALRVVDGKARLVSDRYCDGLGACLGKCPQDAITVEDRPAEEFNEEAALAHQHAAEAARAPKAADRPIPADVHSGCPGSRLVSLPTVSGRPTPRRSVPAPTPSTAGGTELSHWPVQLALIPPHAPFLAGADIALIAHCVPFAYPNVHQDFIKAHAVLIACPKLDDYAAHASRLAAIVQRARPASLTVVHMEVPCCFGLARMAQDAVAAGGGTVPLRDVTVGVRGDVLPR